MKKHRQGEVGLNERSGDEPQRHISREVPKNPDNWLFSDFLEPFIPSRSYERAPVQLGGFRFWPYPVRGVHDDLCNRIWEWEADGVGCCCHTTERAATMANSGRSRLQKDLQILQEGEVVSQACRHHVHAQVSTHTAPGKATLSDVRLLGKELEDLVEQQLLKVSDPSLLIG